ncbi:Ectopic P granules protein 5 [Liparis tanakae]|uniref:Ectopic P granules protein 5 n=1 Tax=Liparis tanakae TaxID=230148 RepID=A0A4Z2FBP5_9TELE|nr:Ectopic P granules protein 5 [Liparis tanakae]
MEAARPKKTRAKTSGTHQLARKQKQAEEDQRATAPASEAPAASIEAPPASIEAPPASIEAPAASIEAPPASIEAPPAASVFTDVPLSLPYEEPVPERPPEASARPPVLPRETLISSPHAESTSALTETRPPPRTSRHTAAPSESNREEEEAGEAAAHGAELRVAECEEDVRSWTRPWISTGFQMASAPSAPALYPALCPSLPALEEGPGMRLCQEEVKNREKGPAVLALPEQESSPPSLQLVDSVVELSRSKLYPELPKTAPEMKPFSLEQLSVWEPAGGLRAWLEGVEVCAAQFCALARQESHELTELLQNYWRCRRQLSQSHTLLHTQSSDCKSTQNRLWSFRDEQLTLQGVCADQSKVCGYHRFQQADFGQSVLAELSRLLEARHCSGGPLKEAISVLFSFTRRVLDDTQFQTDVHHWLERLVAVLLHVGGSGEHLYLLGHLLCCPAGVGKWAAPFLQIQVWGNTCGVLPFMQALAILMSPSG